MCGICGFIVNNNDHQVNINIINKMSNKLRHRGPDNQNIWSDQDSGIYFGHTRLSILDLSKTGNQPMESFYGRFVLIFNGEIYNHLILRKEIEEINNDIKWRGTSDTETLLACLEIWGIELTLNKISGMFAFALWDKKNKLLTLARDRIGEKPLYYGWSKNSFLFGSELKSIKIHPSFENKISKISLSKYFRYLYVPSPLSIYKDIFKLEPGSYVTFTGLNLYKSPQQITLAPFKAEGLNLKKWWNLSYKKKSSDEKNIKYEESTINTLDNILKKAVNDQMISDVPIGGFLSGGIDSSIIITMMQKNSTHPINTFTVGFDDEKFDESVYAKKISKHLGTNHNELFISSKDLLDNIALMPKIYDEPFADSSQLPTYLISQFAKKEVSVSLSGDGGDELFGGYNRYLYSLNIWKWMKFIPYSIRINLSRILLAVPSTVFNKLENPINNFFLKNSKVNNLSDKIYKFASKINNARTFKEFYLSLVSEWNNISDLLNIDNDDSINNIFQSSPKEYLNDTEKMMNWDLNSYLPDDILCKLDRAAMYNSLETRVPFLDENVLKFSSQLPLNMKIYNGRSKWILREILKKYIPENLVERPKMGFSIPLSKWLRGPLKNWSYETLNHDIFKNSELFNYKTIQNIWEDHINLKADNHNKLWSLLVFASWVEDENLR